MPDLQGDLSAEEAVGQLEEWERYRAEVEDYADAHEEWEEAMEAASSALGVELEVDDPPPDPAELLEEAEEAVGVAEVELDRAQAREELQEVEGPEPEEPAEAPPPPEPADYVGTPDQFGGVSQMFTLHKPPSGQGDGETVAREIAGHFEKMPQLGPYLVLEVTVDGVMYKVPQGAEFGDPDALLAWFLEEHGIDLLDYDDVYYDIPGYQYKSDERETSWTGLSLRGTPAGSTLTGSS